MKSFSIQCYGDGCITDHQLSVWKKSGAISTSTIVDLGRSSDQRLFEACSISARIGMVLSMFLKIDSKLLTSIEWLGLYDCTVGVGDVIPWRKIVALPLLSVISIFSRYEKVYLPVDNAIRFNRPTVVLISGFHFEHIEKTVEFATIAFDFSTVKGWLVGPYAPYAVADGPLSKLHNLHAVRRKRNEHQSAANFPFQWMCVDVNPRSKESPVIVYDCSVIPPEPEN